MSDDTTLWYMIATDDRHDEAYAATRTTGGFLDRVRHNTISDMLAHTDVEAILIEPNGSVREDG